MQMRPGIMFETGTVVVMPLPFSATRIVKVIGRVSENNRTYCVQQLCRYLNRGQ
jgi:hypothetical protein